MSEIKRGWNQIPQWTKITLYAILGTIGMALLGFLFGWIIQSLWNWLMPGIFGLKTITYWQAVGLFILFRILFGCFRDRNYDVGSKSRKKKKTEHEKEAPSWEDWKGWKYYDEWWDEEGKEVFRQYAERMRSDDPSKGSTEQ